MKEKVKFHLEWLPYLFTFYKEHVFRKLLPIMSMLIIYAIVIVYEDRTSGLVQKIAASNLGRFHLIFSFILSIIIGFRVNTSYARWWDGRTLWADINNNCLILALKFDTYNSLSKHPEFYLLLQKLPLVIKQSLRKERLSVNRELKALGIMKTSDQPAVQILQKMYAYLYAMVKNNKFKIDQYSSLELHLNNIIESVGKCERIANTATPPAFAIFVKQTLLFYALMFPFGWVDTFGFLIIPIMFMIVYILLGLEILSEELEQPFISDTNNLKLDFIADKISKSVKLIDEFSNEDKE